MTEAVDEAESYLQQVEELFGSEDWRFSHVAIMYDSLTDDEEPLSLRLGCQFLQWVLSHPERVGMEETDTCVCMDGWVPVGDEVVRACSRCRREVYDRADEEL